MYAICISLSLQAEGIPLFPLLNCVRDILYNLGLNNIWDQQDITRVNIDWLQRTVE